MGGSGRRRSSSGRGRRASSGGSGLRQYYAAQLMQPEWLVDVPPDLGTEWWVLLSSVGPVCCCCFSHACLLFALGCHAAVLLVLRAPLCLTHVPFKFHSPHTFPLVTLRYALPRPEGQRCLVISARGQTVTRLRSGVLYERFASRLPAGGPGQGGDDNFCIMDCVYHAADQTYYILGACWASGMQVAVQWRNAGQPLSSACWLACY